MLADFERAETEFEDMGGKPYQARVLRDWGNALKSLGQHNRGDEKLRQAIELFEAMGIKREANEARVELSQWGPSRTRRRPLRRRPVSLAVAPLHRRHRHVPFGR